MDPLNFSTVSSKLIKPTMFLTNNIVKYASGSNKKTYLFVCFLIQLLHHYIIILISFSSLSYPSAVVLKLHQKWSDSKLESARVAKLPACKRHAQVHSRRSTSTTAHTCPGGRECGLCDVIIWLVGWSRIGNPCDQSTGSTDSSSLIEVPNIDLLKRCL